MLFGIVINEQGYKVAFVCVDERDNILHYTLKENEQLIKDDWQIANAMGKPHWTGTEWEDEEPPEQIDICPSPTLDDLVADANETRSRLDTVENAILDLLLKA
ncbi:hypothetical protein QTL86_13505 [Cellulosilyticum sp. ST5]|uniref:hypothetical protein n=1 Tax=Cellulosilyticum sp. ST5 TaxID=3055805 RepID=UPI003977545D